MRERGEGLRQAVGRSGPVVALEGKQLICHGNDARDCIPSRTAEEKATPYVAMTAAIVVIERAANDARRRIRIPLIPAESLHRPADSTVDPGFGSAAVSISSLRSSSPRGVATTIPGVLPPFGRHWVTALASDQLWPTLGLPEAGSSGRPVKRFSSDWVTLNSRYGAGA